MDIMALVRLAPEIHTSNLNAGWWPNVEWGSIEWAGTVCRKTNLIHTEVGEITEAHRKNLQDDHLPQYPGIVAEAADVSIRALDLLGMIDKATNGALLQMPDWQPSIEMLAEKIPTVTGPEYAVETIVSTLHYSACECISYFRKGDPVSAAMSCVILVIQAGQLAKIAGYDLAAVIADKRAYNATRSDHSVAARASANGKKY